MARPANIRAVLLLIFDLRMEAGAEAEQSPCRNGVAQWPGGPAALAGAFSINRRTGPSSPDGRSLLLAA